MIAADLVRPARLAPTALFRVVAAAVAAMLLVATPRVSAASGPSASTAADKPLVLPWLKPKRPAAPMRPLRLKPLSARRLPTIRPLRPLPSIVAKSSTGVTIRIGKPLSALQHAATLRAPLQQLKVSSTFGSRQHPTRKRRSFHYGVDYIARPGTPVLAAQDGVIRVQARRRDYGKHLCIDHGHGVETLYGHLQRFEPALKPGAKVRRGQVIGYVGSTGRATGPHLHFEVRTHGQKVDPMKLALAVKPARVLAMK